MIIPILQKTEVVVQGTVFTAQRRHMINILKVLMSDKTFFLSVFYAAVWG